MKKFLSKFVIAALGKNITKSSFPLKKPETADAKPTRFKSFSTPTSFPHEIISTLLFNAESAFFNLTASTKSATRTTPLSFNAIRSAFSPIFAPQNSFSSFNCEDFKTEKIFFIKSFFQSHQRLLK